MVFAATWIAASLQMMKVVGALAGEPMSPRQYSSGLWLTSGKTRASGPGLSVETYTWSPKASVAANTGQGSDMYWGIYSMPQLFPTKALAQDQLAGANRDLQLAILRYLNASGQLRIVKAESVELLRIVP